MTPDIRSDPQANRSIFTLWKRIFILVALSAALVWEIFRHSIVAYFGLSSPELALAVRSDDPAALVALADQQLNDQGIGQSAEKMRSEAARLKPLVRQALLADPLDARGFRLLGQFAAAENDSSAADKFMREASRLSLSESVAVEWLMRKSFERKNYSAAAYYSDGYLRVRPNLMKYAVPTLGQMAEIEKARPYVVSLLKANPPWRGHFFDQIGDGITDARTPLKLLLELKDSPASPSGKELNSYLNFLVQHKLTAFAYDVWLQFLPPYEQEASGYLHNGGFEAAPSGAPFDWIFRAQGDVSVSIMRGSEKRASALEIDMGPGRTEMLDVSQIVVLAPGAYRFKGLIRGSVTGPRGLRWSIACIDAQAKGEPLGQSQMALGDIPDWRVFAVEIDIPDAGCPAQILKLFLASRSASEELISGTIFYDDLIIERR